MIRFSFRAFPPLIFQEHQKKNMNSRRDFLKLGGMAVVGGLVLGEGSTVFSQRLTKKYFPLPIETYADAPSLMNYEMFEPLIKTVFEVQRGKAGRARLRLVEATRSEYSSNRLTRIGGEGFSLIFEAENDVRLDDKIYKMTHPQLGSISIFVSQVGQSGKRFQAVFNRVYL